MSERSNSYNFLKSVRLGRIDGYSSILACRFLERVVNTQALFDSFASTIMAVEERYTTCVPLSHLCWQELINSNAHGKIFQGIFNGVRRSMWPPGFIRLAEWDTIGFIDGNYPF